MKFSDWLKIKINEGGSGSGNPTGTKFSATGLNAGGRASESPVKLAMPQKIMPSPFSPSDTVPAGYKPKPAPGAMNSVRPIGGVPERKVGISGKFAGKPFQPLGPPKGGLMGGGYPGAK
jgi:hypothetical protein